MTSASTVGLPRESRICRPMTAAILCAVLPGFLRAPAPVLALAFATRFALAFAGMMPPGKMTRRHFNVKSQDLHREHRDKEGTETEGFFDFASDGIVREAISREKRFRTLRSE